MACSGIAPGAANVQIHVMGIHFGTVVIAVVFLLLTTTTHDEALNNDTNLFILATNLQSFMSVDPPIVVSAKL